MNSLINQAVSILIPVIVIPLVMRLIIAPLILFRLKKRYIKEITSTIKEGWVDDRDLEAIEFLKNFAWKGLNSPFVISFNSQILLNQLKLLFFNITKIYNDDIEQEISLKFSIQKITEASYMLFKDLHSDFTRFKLYKILEKLPVNLFLRVTKINKTVSVFTKIRFISFLQKYRITTKIVRILLIPVLGLPILITQLIFSLLYATVFEGYIRFIYGVITLKVGYYSIYLYSQRNSSLHKRLFFSHKDIIKKGTEFENLHTKFKNRVERSPYLDSALEKLKTLLNSKNIMHSRETSEENSSLERFFKRAVTTVKNTLEKEIKQTKSNIIDLEFIKAKAVELGKIYFPKSDMPIVNLRVKEFLELGYFITTIGLKYIYTIPASNKILDQIPLKFILDINSFIDNSSLMEYLPAIKKGGKVLKNLHGYYSATKFIVKRSNPVIFATSLLTPIVFQQLQESLKEGIYNSLGLLLIDAYEATYFKDKNSRIK